LPVFSKEGPSFVIAPATGDLQVPRRIAFAVEASASHQSERGAVRRHDVGLDAMQTDDLERVAQGEW
jgi:hypothetical protein